MANLKEFIVGARQSGIIVYGIIRRESDNAYFDNSTGLFTVTPASAYFYETEDPFMLGTYVFSDSRSVWIDGQYLIKSYKQLGASPNPAIDPGVGYGEFWIDNDQIAELESSITSVQPVVIQAPPTSTSYAASDIITAALQLLGKGRAENLDPINDIANNLKYLNQILQKLLVNGQLSQQTLDEGFTLTAGISQYNIGASLSAASNNFVTTRPVRLESAYIVDTISDIHYQIALISRQEFNDIADQEVALARPEYLFYDIGLAQQASAVGEINLYYVPDASTTYVLHLVSVKELALFTQTTDSVTFGMEYIDFLETALAIRLAPLYGKQVSADLRRQHKENERAIEILNYRQPTNKPTRQMGPVTMNIYTNSVNE